MKKSILVLACLIGITVSGYSQSIVNTGPGNKHTILEEFTGIKCVNCPAGHTEVANIVTAHPDNVHVIAYCPTNSSYTNPSGTIGTDFRRPFADAFYTASYCSPGNGSRFMPSAFINRRLTGGNILQSRSGGAWTNQTNTVLTESAPMNIGLRSIYNASAQTLTIDVEVYYTSNVSVGNSLYVMITEDNLTSNYQSGSNATASNPYIYKHTFRENVSVNQWGDPITGSTTTGSLFTTQYTFDLTTAIDPIVISNAHVVAFVIDANSSNKEVYSGISVDADGGQASTGTVSSGVSETNNAISISSYPNPSSGDVTISISGSIAEKIQVYNILGEMIFEQPLETSNAQSIYLTKETFSAKGMYFVKVSGDNYVKTERLVIH